VRGKKALARCKDGALTVAFDRAAFEHEIKTVGVLSANLTQIVQAAIDGIVESGFKLLSPAVESIVEQAAMAVVVYK
jgi:hypothetical protein